MEQKILNPEQLYNDNNPIKYLTKCYKRTLHRLKLTPDQIKKSLDYLGCNFIQFYIFIQVKMNNWNLNNPNNLMNYYNIHLDHIKPVDVFDKSNEDDMLICCHYTNFQPLLKRDNLYKFNKWKPHNEEFWINHIKGNIYYDKVYFNYLIF
jgi:hypothetical protein